MPKPRRDSGAHEFGEVIVEGLEVQRSDRRESGLPHAALRHFDFVTHVRYAHRVRPHIDDLGRLDDVSRTLMAIGAADLDLPASARGLVAGPKYRTKEVTHCVRNHGLVPYSLPVIIRFHYNRCRV